MSPKLDSVMTSRLLKRYSAYYILIMICVTRGFAFVIGGLCVVYVNLTFNLSVSTQWLFELIATLSILVTAILTVALAHWETRHLRRVLKALQAGDAVDPADAVQASREVVVFPGQHAWNEAVIDPLLTIVPICLILYLFEGVPLLVMLQVGIAGFMGLTAILMVTFFTTEHWLRP